MVFVFMTFLRRSKIAEARPSFSPVAPPSLGHPGRKKRPQATVLRPEEQYSTTFCRPTLDLTRVGSRSEKMTGRNSQDAALRRCARQNAPADALFSQRVTQVTGADIDFSDADIFI
jgi:hypothetical protein